MTIRENRERPFPFSVIIRVAGKEFETLPIRDVGEANRIEKVAAEEMRLLDLAIESDLLDINWIDGAPKLSELREDRIVAMVITVHRKNGVLRGGWCGAL